MECISVKISPETVQWIVVDSVLSLLLTLIPMALLAAIVRSGSLHFAVRCILCNLSFMLLCRMLTQVFTNAYFCLKSMKMITVAIDCSWFLFPSRAFIIIAFTSLPILVIERVMATINVEKYEKTVFYRPLAVFYIIAQYLLLLTILPGLSTNIFDQFCSRVYSYVILITGLLQLFCMPCFVALRRTNLRIKKSKGTSKFDGKYQLRENIKLTKCLFLSSIGSSFWAIVYTLSYMSTYPCFKNEELVQTTFLNIMANTIYVCLVILPITSVRINFLRVMKLQKFTCMNNLCCTRPRHRYQVNDSQQLNSNSLNSHFENLSRQWNGETGQGSLP